MTTGRLEMGYTRLLTVCLFMCGIFLVPDEQGVRRAGLDVKVKGNVAGIFGHPLGEVFLVQATLSENPGTKLTLSNDQFLLMVTHVDGRRLRTPISIPFQAEEETSGLSQNPEKGSDQFKDQLVMIRQGRELSLVVYETGKYDGAPIFPEHLKHLDPMEVRSNYGFCFLSRLGVLKQLE